MNQRFFIRDCNDTIVGNPKGYPTIKGANIQANKHGSKAFNAIWEAYHKARNVNPEHRHLCSIGHFDAA